MRTECFNHRYVYGAPLQGARLVQDIADKYQRCTQTYVRRPYGVGLLVACCDATGPTSTRRVRRATFSGICRRGDWRSSAIGQNLPREAPQDLQGHARRGAVHARFTGIGLCGNQPVCRDLGTAASRTAQTRTRPPRVRSRERHHSGCERFRIEGRLKFYFPTHWPVASLATRNSMPLLLR